MGNIQALYELCLNDPATDEALKIPNKELVEFIESNVTHDERLIFFETIDSISKSKEEYFFKAGFSIAMTLLVEKR